MIHSAAALGTRSCQKILQLHHRNMTQATPSVVQQVSQNFRRRRVMTLAYVFPGARPRAIPHAVSDVYRDVLADATVKTVYFTLVATVFVFASILLTGVHT
jgi:hypothetical protein